LSLAVTYAKQAAGSLSQKVASRDMIDRVRVCLPVSAYLLVNIPLQALVSDETYHCLVSSLKMLGF